MTHHINAQHDGDLGAPVSDVAQEAIDAVAATYAADAGIDVDEQLRGQLSSRGITGVDAGWLAETSRAIRSRHPVRIGRSDGSITPG